jgi:hypothetical protein
VSARVLTPAAARALLALAAVVVLAWLAVMERNTRLEAASLHLLGEGHTARAEANLRDARLLNPDTTPDFRRALLYVTKRQGDRAVATLESVVAREPDNLQAWATLLAFGRSRHDSALVQRALAAVRRLDPLEAPRR